MSATAATAGGYLASPNRMVSAANGIDYAYRDIGGGTLPVVLLQHFRLFFSELFPSQILSWILELLRRAQLDIQPPI